MQMICQSCWRQCLWQCCCFMHFLLLDVLLEKKTKHLLMQVSLGFTTRNAVLAFQIGFILQPGVAKEPFDCAIVCEQMLLEESKSPFFLICFQTMNRNDGIFSQSFARRDWGYSKDDIADDDMFVLQYAFRIISRHACPCLRNVTAAFFRPATCHSCKHLESCARSKHASK